MYEGALVAGRYRLEARIGAGSMGQVWRALDERLQREVAVKTVDLSQANEAVTPERVRREVIATARLNHPNIVTIFDAGTDADIAFLVMELLSGQSLAQLVRAEGVLEVGQVVDIGLQVSRALESTHAIGIVHRDIKPHNVMIGQFGQCKVCDFGIAAVMKDSSFTDRTSALSYRYASPEELDDSSEVGPPTDIFSLGVTLRQILTGETKEARYRDAMTARQRDEAMPDLYRVALAQLDALAVAMTNREVSARPTAAQLLGSVRALEGRLGPALVTSLLSESDVTVPRQSAGPAPADAVVADAPPQQSVGPAPADSVADDATVVRPKARPPIEPVADAPRALPDPNDTPENWWETT